MNGWIILDKPLDLSSTQAVGAIKRILYEGGYAKTKIGHGGTLDPLATGVLPIALGEATKLAGRMLDSDKAYDFTISFGSETDTLDAEGVVVATSNMRPTLAEVEATLPRFTGPISQMPPAYSALKVDGQRAYDLARAGKKVVLQARDVVVYGLELYLKSTPGGEGAERSEAEEDPGVGLFLHKPPPSHTSCALPPPLGKELDSITLSASVSKGTYIRSLARDISYALGTVGHVTMLRRIKAGPFSLAQAISLDKLREAAMAHALEACLLPLRAALADIPVLSLTRDQAANLRMGRVLNGIEAPDGLCLAIWDETPIALAHAASGTICVERGFNL
jgi:tRNA pseudouridine55 synthase